MAASGRCDRRWHIRAVAPLAALAALGLPACAPNISTHGHRLDAAALAQIEPGQSSEDDVVQLLGSPSSLATFDDRTWYYVSQRIERRTFYFNTVVAQDVVAIVFDDQGTVSRIDRHDLNGAREVDLVDRETPTAGNELTVLEQFLGNIGRFNPPEDEDE
jgi:outer membrane protein assembly factor BamE (lipoprotein component of BamABCDE complex)